MVLIDEITEIEQWQLVPYDMIRMVGVDFIRGVLVNEKLVVFGRLTSLCTHSTDHMTNDHFAARMMLNPVV